MRHPPKIESLLSVVRRCLDQGRYLDTRHAFQRQAQRDITRAEVIHVLRNGFHEKRKDRYEERFCSWSYAVRGKTPDKRELRVIVSFEEKTLLIITAIDLKEGEAK